MNKKVMALAVAGALAAPAAAYAQVQIGGSINIQYFYNDGDNKGKTTPSDVLTTSEPEIYIRGEEKLAGGLSAWFQCTSSFDVTGQASSTTNSAGNSAGAVQWCGRNSGLGFRGSFGNVFLGNWDTPHKLVSNTARGWFGGTGTLIGGSQRLIGNSSASGVGNGATTASSGNSNSFFRRQINTVNYHSPSWGGFTLAAAYSASNESTDMADSSGLGPRLYSLSGQYATGPFLAGLGYEQHKDYNPAGVATYTGGTDDSFNVMLGYTIAGQARLTGLYQQIKYEVGGTAAQGKELKTKGYALYLDWRISGPHKLYAQYAWVDDPSGDATVAVGAYAAPKTTAGASVSNIGGNMYTLAYGYQFSKRTELYFAYYQMNNDDNTKGFTQGTVTTTLGGSQKQYGLGVKHSF